jgi:DNA-binding transcriptional LysR family regulator
MIDALDASNLVGLHVLLEERSVTRAARRLGITQSSMSHRLARLRDVFRDPLFVGSAHGFLPTPRARALAAPLAAALREIDALVAPSRPFDVKTTAYTLSIALPDALAPLVPRLISAFSTDAPLFDLRVTPVVPSLSEALAAGEPGLALAPSRFVSGRVITRPLGEVRFGVVGRKGHPAFRGKLTTKRWLAHGHVVPRFGNEQGNAIEAELARHGLRRRVGLEVPSFLAGLFVLPSSDLLMNGPIQLVREAAAQLKLTTREAPIRLPRIAISVCWHERFQHDPAHRWARERVLQVAAPAFRGPP